MEEKAIERGKSQRNQRKEIRRLRKDRDRYKQETKEALKQKEQQKNMPLAENKEYLIFISLQLFLVAHISFRAVSRVLAVLASYMGLAKSPCPLTIINQVTQLSISRI